MVTTRQQIKQNLIAVRQRMAAAARWAHRREGSVTLVAVTKYAEMESVSALVDLGVRDLGESRPQQLWERAELIDSPVRWHLVGSLQRNKARRTLPLVEMIHSVDSLRLIEHLDHLAGELELRSTCLIEVNLSGEDTKHGFDAEDLTRAWDTILSLKNVSLAGFMTMAAWEQDPENTRPTFARLRALRDRLRQRSPDDVPLKELSMGMSNDFEIAIEEGATLVRVGSALFGKRGVRGEGSGNRKRDDGRDRPLVG